MKRKKGKKLKEKLEEIWDEGTDFLSCPVCVMFKKHHQVPPKMLQCRKNDFGLIGKQGKDGNTRSRKDLVQSAKMHTDTDLHQWCFRKAELHQQEVKTFADTNQEVATNIVRAVLKNLKRGLGAQDFMADMDYLHSTPGIPNSQKNDSKVYFLRFVMMHSRWLVKTFIHS